MNDLKSKLKENDLKIDGIVQKKDDGIEKKKNKKAISNFSKNLSKSENQQAKKNKFKTPQAYHFMDVYQKKKEQAIQKYNQEMCKKREFTSRPVPQFYTKPNLVEKKVHYITVPITPEVLKRSICYKEKKKEIQLKLNDDVKTTFKSRPPTVLIEKPFVPKKTLHEAPIFCPFKLQSDCRAEKRKKFDAHVREAFEMKLKYEENKRLQEEKKRIEILKKFAKFKAQPSLSKK